MERPIDTSVTDLSISRERLWKKTSKFNRFGKPVLEDTGWDLVQYEGFATGLEPGVNNFEQRSDGKVSDRKYTGMLILDERDTVAKFATSTGGPIPRHTML
jgi:hypothetical protein